MFNRQHKVEFSIMKSTFILECALAIAVTVAGGCSSDGKPVKSAGTVSNPVSIKVDGINRPDVRDNVYGYLSSLPQISKDKVRLYGKEITDKITLAVHSYGYYHPKIDIDYPKRDEPSRQLVAKVDLGKPLFIRNFQVEILGEGAFYQSFKRIVEKSGIGPYTLLDHGKYEKLKTDLKENAISLGFFDSKLISSRILVYQEQNAADIVLIYDTGKRYKFGNLITDEKTEWLLKPSRSLINFKEGDAFSSATLGNFSTSLSQTNYYRSVDVQPIVEDRKDGYVPVKLGLERQAKNQYRVGIGYSTDEGIRGLLGWDKPLISSHGHSFSSFVRASQKKKTAQAIYKITHKNPNLDYFFIKLAQTRIDLNDTLADISHASFHYVANLVGKWRRDYYIASEYEDYTQSDEKGHSFNTMLGTMISMRTTTGGLDPRAGYSIVWDNKFATKAVSDLTFWKSELTFKGVLSPSENTRFLYKLYQGANLGFDAGKVPPSMRYFAGGDQNLRGFGYKSQSTRNAKDELTGSRYMSAATAEFEFPIGMQNARGAVFLDSAIVTNNYKNDRHLLFGPGVGFRYITPYGIAKLDVACGIDNHRDKRGLRLHLQFGPEF
ncbi:autotransporter assembly complex protein TamA [Succinivibrio dextrinosolvens]|uniref:autotransporter assembly complex protein TamA n=1 Tax=Succinivibrio dextrinosolvens TaxID=83771 RepID=UPI00241FF13C|nr:BamA/TamA family outer membrane protein [Succinivibrio dextrinosolvens]MBE6422302.1 hypothetical protein [Succinivibrio dextrinosolvens]